MGSVKDLRVIQKPNRTKLGLGEFIFSDRYSVFDWGEMPDPIEKKGEALCIIGAYFFERLEERGIKTHYLGVVETGIPKRLEDLDEPGRIMRVRLLRVLKPEVKNDTYDYSIYQHERENFLIPLEVIYRNALPDGSSIFRRLKQGTLKPEDIGFKTMPIPGQYLASPILDVSTKLETTDRYLTWNEAQRVAGLNDEELEDIKYTTTLVNNLISKEVEKARLINEDGKIELGFDEHRNFMLVDVLGTPDECRFTFDGMPISKELARIFYRNSPWYIHIEQIKKKEPINWKSFVTETPSPLPPRLATLISLLYQSFCNHITKREWFDTLAFSDIISEIKEIMSL